MSARHGPKAAPETGGYRERGARLLNQAALAARAAYVLRGNDLGHMTTAAPALYPHMWSWDAAFVAIGLATVNLDRAILELDTLLAAQWSTGMLPHIVFAPGDLDYFPGPNRWGCLESGAPAPGQPPTSGICQPPVHAIAVQRIVEAGHRGERSERRAADAFLRRSWKPLLAWHRWLATARDPDGDGLITVHHGWESGMDNSPRWDEPYSRVRVGPGLPAYQRRDVGVVGDATQRPSDAEYDRYLWLVEQMRRVGYDDALVRERVDFAVQDAFVSAIMSMACAVLAELGEDAGMPAADIAELLAWAQLYSAGVAWTVDPATGLARDFDLRTRSWLSAPTVAGFAPLLCGGLDHAAERRLLALLNSPTWAGDPRLVAALPPSTSPASPAFRPREYWRGPLWPVVAWLFSWAFARRGWANRAAILREEGMRLVADGHFAEYYEPFTGKPLGSMRQSWTAAAVLDWLC
ncbi:MAG TPA: glycogen debranching protein [Pseudonocardiaceae bacterium]|nr:glycogen debranching protein [Pseudonocardiaceae bacterium]